MRALVALLFVIAGAGCDGASWSAVLPSLDRVPLSVWADSPRDVFVAGGPLGSPGDALLLHYDGSAWHEIPTSTSATLWWVFALSPTDVYLAGESGTILRFDGAQLTPMTSGTTKTLYGIWGASDGDLWAVGGDPDLDGVILRNDGTGWRTIANPTTSGAYFKVWGSSSSDVFICGQGGTILHWDGQQLSSQPTGLDPRTTLFTVAGRAPNDVFAVGGLGNATALHYDGASWAPLGDAVLAESDALAGVSVAASGEVVLVGANGTVLRGKPGALVDESRLAVSADLHGTVDAGGEIFAVGGNYFAPAPAARHGVVVHYGGAIAGTLE